MLCQACVFKGGKEEYVKNAEGLDLLIRTWSADTSTIFVLCTIGFRDSVKTSGTSTGSVSALHVGRETKGAVVLVHGFSWHSGYFQDFAEALSQTGETLAHFGPKSTTCPSH